MSKFNVGDVIPVIVGDRKFTTVIDKHGVQRFKVNTVLNAFADGTTAAWDNWRAAGRHGKEPYSINDLTREYHEGKHSFDDMLTFFTSIGYSVGGFCDISIFADLDVRNPLWEKDDLKVLSSDALAEFMALINEPYEHNGNESVRYFTEVVFSGKWNTDHSGGRGVYVAKSDTIDRVIRGYLYTKGISPSEVIPLGTTSDELKALLNNIS